MTGKLSRQHKNKMFDNERLLHFSLRKSHAGLASVAIAASFLFLGAGQVSADTDVIEEASEPLKTLEPMDSQALPTDLPALTMGDDVKDELAGGASPDGAEDKGEAEEEVLDAPVEEVEAPQETEETTEEELNREELSQLLAEAEETLARPDLPESDRVLVTKAYDQAQSFFNRKELTKAELDYALVGLGTALETITKMETDSPRVRSVATTGDVTSQVTALLSPSTHQATVSGQTLANARVVISTANQEHDVQSDEAGKYQLELSGLKQREDLIATTFDEAGHVIDTAMTKVRYYSRTERPANQGQPISTDTAFRTFVDYSSDGDAIYVDDFENLPTDVFSPHPTLRDYSATTGGFFPNGRYKYSITRAGGQTIPAYSDAIRPTDELANGDELSYTNVHGNRVTFKKLASDLKRDQTSRPEIEGLSETGFVHGHGTELQRRGVGSYTTYEISVAGRDKYLLTFGNMNEGDVIKVRESDLLFGINIEAGGSRDTEETNQQNEKLYVISGPLGSERSKFTLALRNGAQVTYVYGGGRGTTIDSPLGAAPNLKPGKSLTATINWVDKNPSRQSLTVETYRDNKLYTGTGGGSQTAAAGVTTVNWQGLPKYQEDETTKPEHAYSVQLKAAPAGYDVFYDDATTITLKPSITLKEPVSVRDQLKLTETEKTNIRSKLIAQNTDRHLTAEMIAVANNGETVITVDGRKTTLLPEVTVKERAPHSKPKINPIDSDDTTISGTGEKGATVTVYIPALDDQPAYERTATVAVDGRWTVTLDQALPLGTKVESNQDSLLHKTSPKDSQTVAATEAEANAKSLNMIVPTVVDNINTLTPDEQAAVRAEILAKNPGLAAQLTAGADAIRVADNGDVTLTYKDASVDQTSYLQAKTVRQKTDRERAEEGRLPLAVTPVKDKNKLTVFEQNQVQKAIEDAYPNLPVTAKITVNANGTGGITFADSSAPITLNQGDLVKERDPHSAPPINPIDSDDTTISGTGEKGATVTVYIPALGDQPAYERTATVAADGSWTVSLNSSLPTQTSVQAEQKSDERKISKRFIRTVAATEAEANFKQPALTFVEDIKKVTPSEHNLAVEAIKEANDNFIKYPATVEVKADDTARVTFTGDGSTVDLTKAQLFIQKLKGVPKTQRVQEKADVPNKTLVMTPNKDKTTLSIPQLPAGLKNLGISAGGYLTGNPVYDLWGKTEEEKEVMVTVELRHAEDPKPVLVNVPITLIRDTDGDGLPDHVDQDDDQDGIADQADKTPKEFTEWTVTTIDQSLVEGAGVANLTVLTTNKSTVTLNDVKSKVTFKMGALPAGVTNLAIDKETGALSGRPEISNWKSDEESRLVAIPVTVARTVDPKPTVAGREETEKVTINLTIYRDTDRDGRIDLDTPIQGFNSDADDDNDGLADEVDTLTTSTTGHKGNGSKIFDDLVATGSEHTFVDGLAIKDHPVGVTANKTNQLLDGVTQTIRFERGALPTDLSGLDLDPITGRLSGQPIVKNWEDKEERTFEVPVTVIRTGANTESKLAVIKVTIERDSDNDKIPDKRDDDDDNDGIPDNQDKGGNGSKGFDQLTGQGHSAIVLDGKDVPAGQQIVTISKPLNNQTMTFSLNRVPDTVTGLSVDAAGHLIGKPVVSNWGAQEESRELMVEVIVEHFDSIKSIEESIAVPVKVTILRDTDGDGLPDVDKAPKGFTGDLDDDNDDIPDQTDKLKQTDRRKVFDDLFGQPMGMTVLEGQAIGQNVAVVSNKVGTSFTISQVPAALTDLGIRTSGDFTAAFTGRPKLSDWASEEESRTVSIEVTLSRRLTTGQVETAIVTVPVTIERDTDGDGTADIKDDDDDGDGIPDVEDINPKVVDALTAEGRTITLIDGQRAAIAPALAVTNKHQTTFFLSDLFPNGVSGLSLNTDGMIIGTPKVSNWQDGETERSFTMRVTANNGSERLTVPATIIIKRVVEEKPEQTPLPEAPTPEAPRPNTLVDRPLISQPQVTQTPLTYGSFTSGYQALPALPLAAPSLSSSALAEPVEASVAEALPETGEEAGSAAAGLAVLATVAGVTLARKRRED